jgi:hypothetical protein
MSRSTRRFWLALTVGLPAAFVLTWWMWSSTKAPPPRTIPPEAFLRVNEEVRLRNERWQAEQVINGTISFVRKANISDYFRRDTMALIEPLRAALQIENADTIAARAADLYNRVSLLGNAARGIEKTTAFLPDFGGELVPEKTS